MKPTIYSDSNVIQTRIDLVEPRSDSTDITIKCFALIRASSHNMILFDVIHLFLLFCFFASFLFLVLGVIIINE